MLVASPLPLDTDAPVVSPHGALSPSARRSAAVAVVVSLVGALVLVGWTFDLPRLKSVYGPITMKTNAALGLLVGGCALWALVRGYVTIARIAAVCCGALGAVTMTEHVFGWNAGIDELLFTEPAGAAATASPNRMGPNASTNFTLAAAAILLLTRGTPRAVAISQRLAMVGLIMVAVALAGYLYGAVELYALARYTGIALHTALALLLFNVGILLARVDHGPMAIFVAEGVAGTLLRRLLLPIVVMPFLLGYLVLLGREAEMLDRGLSLAIFAAATVVVLSVIVWTTARTLADSDTQRLQAERERDLLLVRERRARDEAERANRLKDQFLATLSHELRTPLNVMLGWTQILETDATPERRSRAAAIVARNGRLLARLVSDLLDLSRAAAGQFEIARQPMSLDAAVQATVESLLPAAAAKGIEVRSVLDPTIGPIDADAERIQQIVGNLLSNAVKFTPPGGAIEVRTSRDASAVTLTVSDTGIGFDHSFASQLFKPFRQADPSVQREHGGLGLGLSIARHIAELHGGALTGVSPGAGGGATFTLRLPASDVAAPLAG